MNTNRESIPHTEQQLGTLDLLEIAIETEIERGNYKLAYEITKERDYLIGALN